MKMKPEDVKLSLIGELIVFAQFVLDKVPWLKVIPTAIVWGLLFHKVTTASKFLGTGIDYLMATVATTVATAIIVFLSIIIFKIGKVIVEHFAPEYREYQLRQKLKEIEQIDDTLLK